MIGDDPLIFVQEGIEAVFKNEVSEARTSNDIPVPAVAVKFQERRFQRAPTIPVSST
jgi:hypothetical protein